ncbi:uncharacterized protein LOC114292248 isoform X2 [Camellia sinensis]|uniref:uncharacterized protein LOC114292248 isoform X2 n=1 Tax=Camellia sinensis TaxID=4442 RepID=UPI00103636A3|nr:uncharacterized protein LOC114292248 isoform X2 [Camellia sinensis]
MNRFLAWHFFSSSSISFGYASKLLSLSFLRSSSIFYIFPFLGGYLSLKMTSKAYLASRKRTKFYVEIMPSSVAKRSNLVWIRYNSHICCSVGSIQMKNGKEFLLTDSVGFIQKLPTTMIDKASDPLKIKLEAEKRKDAVCISAINGNGLDEFCSAVQEKLKEFDAGFIPMIGKICIYNANVLLLVYALL